MTWLYVALAIVLDGAAGLAGGVLPERWLERRRPALIGFAAGTLLGVAFLEILPEAIAAAGTTTLTWTLVTLVAMALFEWLVHGHRHRRGGSASPTLPLALLGSDALHNLADGAAIAAAFLVSPRAGVVTAAAVILHEVPEELADYALLRASGLGRRRALFSLAGVQLTAALGALATLSAWSSFARLSGPILAVAGGTFLYIGAADLLPDVLEVREGAAPRTSALIGFLAGVGLLFVLEA